MIYTSGVVAGKAGDHFVILATLSKTGNNMAAAAATDMRRSFPSIQDIIFVGIAAGVPRPNDPNTHVRLGDVIFSSGQGVVQLDFGAAVSGTFNNRDSSPPPSMRLLQALVNLESDLDLKRFDWSARVQKHLADVAVRRPSEKRVPFKHPRQKGRQKGIPMIFKGKIGASNTLFRDASLRDTLAEQHGLLALEMEGSGIADATWVGTLGYLLIRASCDYGDPNKDDAWQRYSANVAAVALTALLDYLPSDRPRAKVSVREKGRIANQSLDDSSGFVRLDVTEKRLTSLAWTGRPKEVACAGFEGKLFICSEGESTEEDEVVSGIVRCLSSEPDGLLIGANDGEVIRWTKDHKKTLCKADGSVFSVVSHSSNLYLTADRSGSVELWQQVSTDEWRKLRNVHKHIGPAFHVFNDPQAHILESCGADGLLLRSNSDGANTLAIQASQRALMAHCRTQTHTYLGDDAGRLLAVDANGVVEEFGRHDETIRVLASSRCGTWLVSGSKDRTVRLWHTRTATVLVLTVAADYVYDVQFSPAGEHIAFVDGSGTLGLIELPMNISRMLPTDAYHFVRRLEDQAADQ